MITAVDTNVLLDILVPGQDEFAESSERALEAALASGVVIIGEAVYAELALHFGDRVPVDTFLKDTGIAFEPSPREALVLAAASFRDYLNRRGQGFFCPRCGESNDLVCTSCGAPIQTRQHALSDFFIGGHGLVCADCLLTRDRGLYRTYFPKLRIESP